MIREPVESSNILSIGYDPEKFILEVEFKDDTIYHYFEVPENHYKALMSALSQGKYLSQFIKPNFDFKRIFPIN
jgi:hypothetical protein